MSNVSSERRPRSFLALFAVALAATVVFVSRVGADTHGNPDTTTQAAVDPAAPNTDAPATFSNAVEGTKINVKVTGPAGKLHAADARLCKPNLDIQTASQMDPQSFGNCIPKPFVGNDQDDPSRTDDSFVSATSDASGSTVNLQFRVGTGTQTFTADNGSSTITCDATHACALWIEESVDTSIKSSGNLYKHYDITYAGAGGTTTTTQGATTTTTAPTTTTTSHATTTTTAHATTTTTAGGATTTTAPGATTTTTAHGTTTTVAGATTTTTTSSSGVTVSPSSVPPGGTINVTSSGWAGGATVTVVMHSDPVTLGTMVASSTGTATGSFTIPSSATVGSHTLDLSGTGASGSARTVSGSFSVTSSTTATTSRPSALSRTGRDIAGTVLFALLLIGAGAVLTRARRRAPHSS